MMHLVNADHAVLALIREQLGRGTFDSVACDEMERCYAESSFPGSAWGIALTLYQPGNERLMVVRVEGNTACDNLRRAIRSAQEHQRFPGFDLRDRGRCRLQVDLILDKPERVNLADLSESAVVVSPDGRSAPAAHRFELGVDGLRIVKQAKRRYLLPGDAFVRSLLGMNQLCRYIARLFPEAKDLDELEFYRFRSRSYVSTAEGWVELYRGIPVGRPKTCQTGRGNSGEPPRNSCEFSVLAQEELFALAQAGVDWLLDHQFANGQFLYYYDAATGTRRDHEHPGRDPERDPYYNLLRHCGAVVTLLLYEAFGRGVREENGKEVVEDSRGDVGAVYGDDARKENQKSKAASSRRTPKEIQEPKAASGRRTPRQAIEAGCEWFVKQLVTYTAADGTEAAYAFYNRKAKLGGSGLGLYMLALYQQLFDGRYERWARLLANHLLAQIQSSGEFKYYHIYLDQPVAEDQNGQLFSFYYPGEALIGLASYREFVCQTAEERDALVPKIRAALRYLLVDRPRLHAQHYQSLPSDAWLMMAINELSDRPEFQEDSYRRFVFADADQMVAHQYTEANALYPDYVGSFYYQYGDHPYPDGARAEGLLSAFCLALKAGDGERAVRYRAALERVAWATSRLCNTPESVYAAANPEQAVGGIRFKLTRQWFRIDTIQHVASFYLKYLSALRSLESMRREAVSRVVAELMHGQRKAAEILPSGGDERRAVYLGFRRRGRLIHEQWVVIGSKPAGPPPQSEGHTSLVARSLSDDEIARLAIAVQRARSEVGQERLSQADVVEVCFGRAFRTIEPGQVSSRGERGVTGIELQIVGRPQSLRLVSPAALMATNRTAADALVAFCETYRISKKSRSLLVKAFDTELFVLEWSDSARPKPT